MLVTKLLTTKVPKEVMILNLSIHETLFVTMTSLIAQERNFRQIPTLQT